MLGLFQEGVNVTAYLIVLKSVFIDTRLVKCKADLINVDGNILEALWSLKRTSV